MRFRVIHEGKGTKPWALVVENDGIQVEKRDYASQAAAEKARDKLLGIVPAAPEE